MAQTCVMTRPRQQEHFFTPGKQPLGPQLDTSLITSTVRKRKVDPGDTPHQQQQAAGAGAEAQLASEDGKRQRTPPTDRGLAHCGGADGSKGGMAGVARVLMSPAAQVAVQWEGGEHEDWQQQPGHPQHQRMQQQQQQEADNVAGGNRGAMAASDAQQQQQQQQPLGGTVLFSPAFHLHREGSVAELAAACADEAPHAASDAAAAAAADAAERSSTDHSTGTSACLGVAGGVVEDEGEADDGEGSSGAATAAHDVMDAAPAMTVVNAGDDTVPGQQHQPPQPQPDPADLDDYDLEFDPLLFIKRLPPLDRCVPPRRDFLLPKKTRRSKQKTLVLDLDETLVHSTLDGYCRPDFTFPVEVGAMRHMVSVRQRPHLHTFLERVAQLYEVVVFTASQRVYAEQLLNIVDPERRLVRHRVYRESCVFWEGNYLKDLTVLGRDLAHTIIVDNSPQAFGFQIDNGIPIESWYDDDNDEELLKLIPFLEKVAQAEDVRPHIQRRFRLRSLVEAVSDPEALVYAQQQYQQYHHQVQQQQQQHAAEEQAAAADAEAREQGEQEQEQEQEQGVSGWQVQQQQLPQGMPPLEDIPPPRQEQEL